MANLSAPFAARHVPKRHPAFAHKHPGPRLMAARVPSYLRLEPPFFFLAAIPPVRSAAMNSRRTSRLQSCQLPSQAFIQTQPRMSASGFLSFVPFPLLFGRTTLGAADVRLRPICCAASEASRTATPLCPQTRRAIPAASLSGERASLARDEPEACASQSSGKLRLTDWLAGACTCM